jgi:ribose 5-phosphate isomerase B
MKIYIGTDHGGFELKQKLVDWLASEGYEIVDLGAKELEAEDDFVDYALLVTDSLAFEPEARGILLCRNGVGMDIVANRAPEVRCALGFDSGQVEKARSDDNINCLSLPADYIDEVKAKELVEAFLKTKFSGEERFVRRLDRLAEVDSHQCVCGGGGSGHCHHH